MIESIIAWVLLVVGIVTQEADWFIASGVFSVAANVAPTSYRVRRN